MQALAEVIGDLIDLVAFVNLNRLARRINDNLAVVALRQVGAHLFKQIRWNLAVEVISKLA
jgi:hypothetical protein